MSVRQKFGHIAKTASAVLLALGGASVAQAANDEQPRYLLSLDITGKSVVQEWVIINHLYTSWKNQNGPYGCSSWAADVSSVDWGTAFQQSRNCSQGQVRTVTPVLFNSVLNTTKMGVSSQESRVITVAQFQPAVGARDFVASESIKPWSSWQNDGGHYGCDAWSPLPETVNLHDEFEQSRTCSQNQTRERNVMDVWASGKETLKRKENDAQSILETEKQLAIGAKNYIAGARNGAWSAWSNIGEHYSCGTWSPGVDTINLQDNFTQTRQCSQDQTSARTVYDVWRDGSETANREELRGQTITETESQPAIGTKDYVVSTRNAEWTAWANQGGHYGCDTWSPNVDSQPFGAAFNQTRNCSQNQTRQRDVMNVWRSGKETLKLVEPDSQVLTEQETQPAVGTKDYISGSRTGAWTAWTNEDAPYDCTAWSPDVSTVNLQQSFTQSRTCSQNQKNSRDIFDVWASGKETLKTTESGAQTITVTQSQAATGTKDYVTGVAYGAWTAWADSGLPYSCGTWAPAVDTVNLGDAFTQSRSCSQGQVRDRAVYDVYKSGAQVQTGTEQGSQVIAVGQTQPATGTKDYITGTRTGDWGAWSSVGEHYACGTWSPSTGTYDYSVVFTQTRSCSQEQTRSRTIYNVWRSGTETVKNTESGGQTISETESQSAVGTRDYNTGTVEYGAWSAWSDSGAPYSCGTWAPGVDTVNLGTSFTQNRNCSQDQTRTRNVFNVWASGYREPAGTQTGNQTVSVTKSQGATGTKDYISGTAYGAWSSWTNSGSSYGCGSWGPSTGSVSWGQSFTQTASCSQDQSRSRAVYDVWASGAQTSRSTENGYRTTSVTESRSATGTYDYVVGSSYGGWSGWSDSGGLYGCSSWSPSSSTVNLGTTFTQSRSCSQSQTRTRAIYDNWASGRTTSGGTDSDSRTVSVGDSQSATGSKDYVTGTTYGPWSGWSNSGGPTGCSGWSPSCSTVNMGTSFSQSQTCSQAQTQSRTIYDVWASGAQTAKGTDTGSQTVSVTQNQSATGCKNYVNGSESAYGSWVSGGKTCGAWSPDPSTVSSGTTFTQSRSCSEPFTRTVTVYNVWADGSKTVASTNTESSTSNTTETQSATGTKQSNYYWLQSGMSCGMGGSSDWSIVGQQCYSPGSAVWLTEGERCMTSGNMMYKYVCK